MKSMSLRWGRSYFASLKIARIGTIRIGTIGIGITGLMCLVAGCGGAKAAGQANLKEQGKANEQARHELYDLLNDYRQKSGRLALTRHRGVERVAQAHSADMVQKDYLAHRSPSGTTPSSRLKAAGYQSGLVLENVGEAPSALVLHQQLLRSPAHRANIVNPDVTHLGIGLVRRPDGNYVATQLMATMAEEIDVGRAPELVLQGINKARTARGFAPLTPDPNLTREAQKGADAYFQTPELSQQDVVGDASSELRRFSIAFSRVGGVMAVVTRLQDANHLEPTFDRDLRYAGIGVAQGSRPDSPPNAIAVVIMFAWPR